MVKSDCVRLSSRVVLTAGRRVRFLLTCLSHSKHPASRKGARLLSLARIAPASSLFGGTFRRVLKHAGAFNLFMGKERGDNGGRWMCMSTRRLEGLLRNGTDTRGRCGRTRRRCQGDGWGRSASAHRSLERKKGEFTETGPTNNDPRAVEEASVFSVREQRTRCCLERETRISLFRLIRPQLNDKEEKKLQKFELFKRKLRCQSDSHLCLAFYFCSISER